MSSKSTNNQGRRTPLTLSQSKFASSQQQPMNKRSTPANKSEPTVQREQETRSKQQQQQKLQQQQQQQQQQLLQQHLRKEEERKEAAATAASAAGPGPVPLVIIPNTEHKETQQAAALNNGYNKNEAKNGTVTNAATNGNQSTANTQVNDVKQERETRQNSTSKQAKEQEQQQTNNAASTTAKIVIAMPTNTVQRKQQLQAAELKTPPSPNAKKPVEEKIEAKQQAPIAVVENAETVKKAKQQTAAEPESVTTSTPAAKKQAQPQSPSSNKKELKQETQSQAEEKAVVSTPIATEVQPAKPASPTIAPKISPVKKYSVTTTVDLADMNDLKKMDVSPQKCSSHMKVAPVAVADNPNATSTPDKYLKIGWLPGFNTPEQTKSVPMRNLAISGRRSIHREWSEYENNAHLRGSYRRIKTDLDSTADTNTSLNVTVGSERGNSSWFSFSSRKRERTPNNVEGIKDELMSPPKRARFESLFSIMASPLTALRSRFAKTNIHANSSAIKSITEEQEEKNVSMEQESIQEVEDLLPLDIMESKENTSSQELNNKDENAEKLADNASTAKEAKENDFVDVADSDDDADIEILEATDSSNTVAHKKRCDIM